jgi:hypothetical protein
MSCKKPVKVGGKLSLLRFDPENGGDIFLRNISELHGVTTLKTILLG